LTEKILWGKPWGRELMFRLKKHSIAVRLTMAINNWPGPRRGRYHEKKRRDGTKLKKKIKKRVFER